MYRLWHIEIDFEMLQVTSVVLTDAVQETKKGIPSLPALEHKHVIAVEYFSSLTTNNSVRPEYTHVRAKRCKLAHHTSRQTAGIKGTFGNMWAHDVGKKEC
jgi:hypothetical protein